MLDVQIRSKIWELSLGEFSAIGPQRDGTQVTSSHCCLVCYYHVIVYECRFTTMYVALEPLEIPLLAVLLLHPNSNGLLILRGY